MAGVLIDCRRVPAGSRLQPGSFRRGAATSRKRRRALGSAGRDPDVAHPAVDPELTMTAADLEEAAQYLKWTPALEETPPPPEEWWAVEPDERTIAPEERHAFA